jgi:hypothetical protein
MRAYFGVRRPRRRFGFIAVSRSNDPKRRRAALAAALRLVISLAITFYPITSLAQHRATVTVNITPGHPANRIVPARALGAAIDGHEKGTNDLQLTPPNIQAMQSAGFKSLTYRLRTELAGDVWHWNTAGSWSDPKNRQGYWVSDSKLEAPISLSYGFSLPRRGNTIDQATDVGYSRLDDGDTKSFWKSDPYLDREFTGESNSLHPQWIVIEFQEPEAINAVRIVWGQPFAETYRIQYGNFDDVSDLALNSPGVWKAFPSDLFVGGAQYAEKSKGDLLQVSKNPIKVRWLRILMSESSGSSGTVKSDVRDRLGFAVREVYAGTLDHKGKFHDRVHHAADRRKQTIIHVSSTDPWHRESDLDDGVEQIGLDRIYQTGLTNGLPMLLPTGLLYDTPDNAANEIRYLRARGDKFDRVELGEEPDGQYITPEDFGALYLQWAEAIHRVDPNLQLGGPSFQEIITDEDARASNRGNGEWMRRFRDYLKRRGRSSDYSFFSFEWYPFDDVCAPLAPQLARAPRLLEDALREMERRGVSRQIPWIISEYGYSAFAARAEISIEGALLNADIVGKFLTLGGDQAFLFGYTPSEILREVPCTAGNNMLFSMEEKGNITHRFATYFGARLLTQEWLQPGDQIHEVYPANSDVKDENGNQLITAYAVHRPDGLWSVLLINKDPKRSYETMVGFRQAGAVRGFDGQVEFFQYSSKQYLLGGPLNNPYPVRTDEPEHKLIQSSARIDLPAYSLVVIRGSLRGE